MLLKFTRGLFLLSLAQITLYAGNSKASLLIEPQHVITPLSPNHYTGEYELRRANLKIKTASQVQSMVVFANLKVDFNKEDPLKSAFAGIQFHPFLTLHAGKLKTPLGNEVNTASSELFLLERTQTSTFIKKEFLEHGLGGYQTGLMLSGSLPGSFSYKAGLFKAPAYYLQNNFSYLDLISTELVWNPIPLFETGYSNSNNSIGLAPQKAYRIWVHELYIKFNVGQLYQGNASFFLGDESFTRSEIYRSFNLLNSVLVPFFNHKVKLALGGEWLEWGKHASTHQYRMAESLKYIIFKKSEFQLGHDNLYNDSFKSLNQHRVFTRISVESDIINQ